MDWWIGGGGLLCRPINTPFLILPMTTLLFFPSPHHATNASRRATPTARNKRPSPPPAPGCPPSCASTPSSTGTTATSGTSSGERFVWVGACRSVGMYTYTYVHICTPPLISPPTHPSTQKPQIQPQPVRPPLLPPLRPGLHLAWEDRRHAAQPRAGQAGRPRRVLPGLHAPGLDVGAGGAGG